MIKVQILKIVQILKSAKIG